MYVINDKELMENIEDLLEEQGCVDVAADGMVLRYEKREDKVITILLRIEKLSRFIEYSKRDDYHKPNIKLVIPEGIDIVGSLFYDNVGGAVDINARLIDAVSLPSTCEVLSDRAFYGCYNLERIDWCNLKKVGYRALLHTRIRMCEIPVHIETDAQVCSNYDEATSAGVGKEDRVDEIVKALTEKGLHIDDIMDSAAMMRLIKIKRLT